ncbi:MAG: zinc ribbon domain-containing protein, partial [Planctomycetota bacterium]
MSEGTSADPQIDILCPACGYDLRAGTSTTCPECGAPIDREELAKPSIPWAIANNPSQKITGFISTVLHVTFRDQRIWRQIARPVDRRAARWFHLTTVAMAWLGLVGVAATYLSLHRSPLRLAQRLSIEMRIAL